MILWFPLKQCTNVWTCLHEHIYKKLTSSFILFFFFISFFLSFFLSYFLSFFLYFLPRANHFGNWHHKHHWYVVLLLLLHMFNFAVCTYCWIEEESVDLTLQFVEETSPICPLLSPLLRCTFLRRLRESERKRKWLWITATCIIFNGLC